MPISTINQNGLNAPLTLTSPVLTTPTLSGTTTATTVTSPAATALTLQSAGTTAVTIDTSQNVGIGITPDTKFEVSGTGAVMRVSTNHSTSGTLDLSADATTAQIKVSWYNSAVPLVFKSGNTEQMRIATNGTASFNYNSSDRVTFQANSASNPFGLYLYYSAIAPNGTGNDFLYAADINAVRAVIRSNGGLANYSANNVNLSDAREKTNVELAGNYLSKICSIPVKTFNYIDQNREDDDGLTLGVVAQDVQAVAPELVSESDWSVEKDGSKMRLSIYQTDLQYALMKSIQELKAEFDAYKASHP